MQDSVQSCMIHEVSIAGDLFCGMCARCVCVCVCVKIGQTSSMVFDWYMVEGTFVFCKLLYCTTNFTLH